MEWYGCVEMGEEEPSASQTEGEMGDEAGDLCTAG